MLRGRRFWGFLSLGGAVVGVLLAISTICAQPFSVPRSDLIIDGQIKIQGDQSVRFVARDGTFVSLQNLKSGGWYAFSPVVVDQDGGVVNIAAYAISPSRKGGEALDQFDLDQDVVVGASGKFPLSADAIEITVLGIRTGRFSQAAITDIASLRPLELQRRFGAIGGGLCSLACGSLSVGATSVGMSCGSCQGNGSEFPLIPSSGEGR